MGLIISVINNKGGVGKTTVACNLAHALGNMGRKILVADFDNQCNSTDILLKSPIPAAHSLYEILNPATVPRDITHYIQPTKCRNVSILPNIPETAVLEPDLISARPESFFRFREHVRSYAADEFDYVVCDCPPNIGTFVLCSLYASDIAIVPIRAGSLFSVDGLLKAMDLIREIRNSTNKDLRFLKLLINLRDGRTAISKGTIDHIRNTFDPDQIFETEIPVNTAFERAEQMKDTIFNYDPNTAGARSFRALSRELVALLED